MPGAGRKTWGAAEAKLSDYTWERLVATATVVQKAGQENAKWGLKDVQHILWENQIAEQYIQQDTIYVNRTTIRIYFLSAHTHTYM